MGTFAAIVAGLEFGWNVLNGILNKSKQDAVQQAAATQNAADTKVGIAQATAEVSSYQDYLAKFPAYASYREGAYKNAEKNILGQQTAALGLARTQAAASGSIALAGTSINVAESTASKHIQEAQSLYDQGFTQLTNQLDTQKKTAESQLGIYQLTLSTLQGKEAAAAAKKAADAISAAAVGKQNTDVAGQQAKALGAKQGAASADTAKTASAKAGIITTNFGAPDKPKTTAKPVTGAPSSYGEQKKSGTQQVAAAAKKASAASAAAVVKRKTTEHNPSAQTSAQAAQHTKDVAAYYAKEKEAAAYAKTAATRKASAAKSAAARKAVAIAKQNADLKAAQEKARKEKASAASAARARRGTGRTHYWAP